MALHLIIIIGQLLSTQGMDYIYGLWSVRVMIYRGTYYFDS